MPKTPKKITQLMLHLHCTAKLAKTLKSKLLPAPNQDELDWLDCWYIRDIPLDLPLDALLFTNAATCYSLVHPFDRRESKEEITLIFQQRLAWITGKPLPNRPEPFQICKTASPRILGCMNEQAYTILYKVEDQLAEDGVMFEKIEDHLNDGIFGGLFPKDEFQERLKKNEKKGFKTTETPHLKLVK